MQQISYKDYISILKKNRVRRDLNNLYLHKHLFTSKEFNAYVAKALKQFNKKV